MAGNSDQGATNGLPVGGYVVERNDTTNLGTYNLDNLYARSHIQSYGERGCSLKPDSRLPGNVVDGAETIDGRCGTSEVVPEQITVVLLGSGLLGLGGVQARRRRQRGETDV